MRQTNGHSRVKRPARPLAVAGLLAVLLAGCGRVTTMEVSALSSPPTQPPAQAPAPVPEGAVSSFQGQVAAIDARVGEIVVAVSMVWTPVFEAGAHERRVVLDPHTAWEPLENTIDLLHVGDEVQVTAVEASDGSWRASKVQLFDID
jgi:hypothetical protein